MGWMFVRRDFCAIVMVGSENNKLFFDSLTFHFKLTNCRCFLQTEYYDYGLVVESEGKNANDRHSFLFDSAGCKRSRWRGFTTNKRFESGCTPIFSITVQLTKWVNFQLFFVLLQIFYGCYFGVENIFTNKKQFGKEGRAYIVQNWCEMCFDSSRRNCRYFFKFFSRSKVHKRRWEKNVVYLYQLHRQAANPNISPFCFKVETWLRAHQIRHEVFLLVSKFDRSFIGVKIWSGWKNWENIFCLMVC